MADWRLTRIRDLLDVLASTPEPSWVAIADAALVPGWLVLSVRSGVTIWRPSESVIGLDHAGTTHYGRAECARWLADQWAPDARAHLERMTPTVTIPPRRSRRAELTGAELRRSRRGLGVSIEQMAALAGVGTSTLGGWERCGVIPRGRQPLIRDALDHLAERTRGMTT